MSKGKKSVSTQKIEDEEWQKQTLQTYEKDMVTSTMHNMNSLPDQAELDE